MDAIVAVLDSHGPFVLFAIGFAEYAGAPIASVPLLIAAGALSGTGGPALGAVVLLAALGGLAADALWFGLARWRGRSLVHTACGLSPNPGTCVTGVEARVERLGARYILGAKFIPGAGNLIAPAAGFGCYGTLRFLALDGIALLMWAMAYAGLGRALAPQVEMVIRAAARFATGAVLLGAALVVLGGGYRVTKARAHRRRHDAGGSEGQRGTEVPV